jgi:hypothetical protein
VENKYRATARVAVFENAKGSSVLEMHVALQGSHTETLYAAFKKSPPAIVVPVRWTHSESGPRTVDVPLSVILGRCENYDEDSRRVFPSDRKSAESGGFRPAKGDSS